VSRNGTSHYSNQSKMKILVIILIQLTVTVVTMRAQDHEYLVTIDPEAVTFEGVQLIPNVNWIYSYLHAMDEVNQRYFFIQALPANLITLSLPDGTEMNNSACDVFNEQGSGIGSMHYNPTDELLYGMYFDSTEGEYFLVSIDPEDCSVNVVSDPVNVGSVFVNESDVFDPVNGRYIYYRDIWVDDGGIPWLLIYDIQSGILLNELMVEIGENEFFSSMVFDSSNGTLYAIVYDFVSALSRLVAVNTDDGSVDQIGSTFELISGDVPSRSVDIESRLFYLQSGVASGDGGMFSALSLETGEYVYEGVLLEPSGGLFGGPNIVHGEYCNSLDVFFGLYWGPQPVMSIQNLSSVRTGGEIYPNPNQGTFQLKTAPFIRNGRLRVFNSEMKLVREIVLAQGHEQLIESNLPPGVYSVLILSESHFPLVKRMVVE
jgi:hypothetical protein